MFADVEGRWRCNGDHAAGSGNVRKELSFCAKMRLPVLGILENMSGFVCPNCAECSEIFGRGGGEALATQSQCSFLGAVPLDPRVSAAADEGKLPLRSVPDSPAVKALREAARRIVEGSRA